MKQERKYQKEELEAVKADYDAGTHRLLIAAATGTGKTVFFAQLHDFMALGGLTIVLAHREKLVQQAAEKIRNWNPHLRVDVEMAEHYADVDNADIIVASVGTLGRDGSPRIARIDRERVRIIVTDEAHHSPAQTYMNIYQHFGALDADSKILMVGVTATATGRGDGQGLAKVYQKISYNYPLRKAIEDGWLADIRSYRVLIGANLDDVKTKDGDFDQAQLAEQVNTPQNNAGYAKAYLELGDKRKFIGFTVNIQHAKDMADTFNKFGIPSAAIWGDDPDGDTKLELHRRGHLRGLFNAQLLVEGYDDWTIGLIINGAPTKSTITYPQRVGRGTRIDDAIGNLKLFLANGGKTEKVDCIVLDGVGSTKRHSLVTLPTLFGMAANMDLKGKSAIEAIKQIEKAQKENPLAQFDNITSLDQIKVKIEEVELWNITFPPEVVANSQLSWHKSYDGAFVLHLPPPMEEGVKLKHEEKVEIRQNVMGQFEVKATIRDQKYQGVRSTVDEIFAAADQLILKVATDRLRVLQREAAWHDEPITKGQTTLLKRLLKGKPIPPNLTKGQATLFISKTVASTIQPKGRFIKGKYIRNVR